MNAPLFSLVRDIEPETELPVGLVALVVEEQEFDLLVVAGPGHGPGEGPLDGFAGLEGEGDALADL
ncbi:MAG: hypothetical protein P8Y14_30315, partial [Anaerolineales bacterium]